MVRESVLQGKDITWMSIRCSILGLMKVSEKISSGEGGGVEQVSAMPSY
jgi:hypothetical protein